MAARRKAPSVQPDSAVSIRGVAIIALSWRKIE
jgi:hypothetical protein